MTAEATPESVRGDFSGATLASAGVTARMDRDARGGYRMTARPGAPARTVEVARTVGSRRYQQYLAREGDIYWRLPVAWHVEDQRWFPMTSAFLFADPADDAPAAPGRPVYGGGDFDRHVTRWNDNCVFCHNVAPNPARDPATGRFATTTTAELGIACEACHGPGAEHVARNADPFRRWALGTGDRVDPDHREPCAPAAGARRLGALLEVMAADRYPAVRYLAWRGVRRLIGARRAAGERFCAPTTTRPGSADRSPPGGRSPARVPRHG